LRRSQSDEQPREELTPMAMDQLPIAGTPGGSKAGSSLLLGSWSSLGVTRASQSVRTTTESPIR
jgi:hypothetical protein